MRKQTMIRAAGPHREVAERRPAPGRGLTRTAAISLAAAVALTPLVPMTASAQIDTVQDIIRLQEMTPSCRDNPNATWIGRVSGSYTDMLDNTRPLSLVGCFNSQPRCNAWKERVSGRIPGPLVQYSCNPR